jgi:hypothetical protein
VTSVALADGSRTCAHALYTEGDSLPRQHAAYAITQIRDGYRAYDSLSNIRSCQRCSRTRLIWCRGSALRRRQPAEIARLIARRKEDYSANVITRTPLRAGRASALLVVERIAVTGGPDATRSDAESPGLMDIRGA